MRSCNCYCKFCYLFSILTTFSFQFVLYFKFFWSILLGWFYHLIIVLNYFDYICNTTFLAVFFFFFFFFFPVYYTVLPPSALCPFPLCGIRAILFWSVIVLLCSLLFVCGYPKLWYSFVVFPFYHRWRHLSCKVNSQNRTVRLVWARKACRAWEV